MSRIILKILLLLKYALFYGGVMNVNKLDLPSNEKFGFFFTFVFAVATVYFYYSANIIWAYVFFAAASIFLFITMIKSDALLPLNKLWMYFGILLGMIVSPIVLGIVFFGLFTPIAMFMRLSGRDELRLKFTQKTSHWISRNERIKSESFKDQF
tara:strand:- start:71 stop:532 length:462 start_codon:yes stop_codon:yes gene_type:complete